MDPVEPWIDVAAVRRMAAQLLTASPVPEISGRPEAGFGPGFEGFIAVGEQGREEEAPPRPFMGDAAPVAGDVRVQQSDCETTNARTHHADPPRQFSAIEPKREDSEEIGVATAEPIIDQDRPSDARRGPLVERLERFREWLARHAEARGVFILDRDGNPVLDDPSYAKLHFLARSLAQAYRPVAGQAGNVHVKVEANAYLVVIPVDTAFGRLVLGAVLKGPLEARAVEIVSKALADVARPERR